MAKYLMSVFGPEELYDSDHYGYESAEQMQQSMADTDAFFTPDWGALANPGVWAAARADAGTSSGIRVTSLTPMRIPSSTPPLRRRFTIRA